jgi:serine protease Do
MKQKTSLITLSIVFIFLLTACSGTASALSSNLSNNVTGALAQVNPTPTVAPSTVTLSSSALAIYQTALEDIYAKVNPSVVSINVVDQQTVSSPGNPFFNSPGNQGNGGQQYSQGLASGFVWDSQGNIVTNNHVVDGATTIQVTFADGTAIPATLVGTDPDSDLAVIKVDPKAHSLTPVQVADSTQVKIGQVAIAIGNPFGLENSMTVGIVSGLGRSLPTGQASASGSTYTIPDIIQTDAPINPGNSGGVLLNDLGQVIGVTSAIESPVQASVGIGYVIPSSLVQRVVPELIKNGTYQHSYLGVEIGSLTPDVATAMNLNATQRGALVVSVASGGPAEKAGLQGSNDQTTIAGQPVKVGGDVITAIDGTPVNTSADLIAYLAEQTTVGQKVTLTILRSGKEQTVDVTLEARPAQTTTAQLPTLPNGNHNGNTIPSGTAWLGISAQPLVPAIAQAMGLDNNQTGVLVQQVVAGSPADQAGLKGSFKPVQINGQRVLVGGDIITAIDGQTVTSMNDLRGYLSTAQPEQQVTLDILRNGQSQQVKVTLGQQPSTTP